MAWPMQIVAVTGSTNADLVAAAHAGDRGPRVLVARQQTQGRGRLERTWVSPAEASLSLSVLWSPTLAQSRWTWLPMVVGLAVLDALGELGVQARLKWPNDVVVETGSDAGPGAPGHPGVPGQPGAITGLAKLAGILVEAVANPQGPLVVAGIGLNLDTPHEQFNAPATSVRSVVGTPPPFGATAAVLANALQRRVLAWDEGGAGNRQDYLRVCTTIGRQVRVDTPGGVRQGTATDVDDEGALVLATCGGLVTVSAGDVVHVR